MNKKICAYAVILGLFALQGLPLWADAPGEMYYRGQLPAGDPNSNGQISVTFIIWDAATGGNQLFTETQPGVPVTNGVFTVSIGATNGGIPPSVIQGGPNRWLEIDTPTTSQRLKLESAAYAMSVAGINVNNGNIGLGTPSPNMRLSVIDGSQNAQGYFASTGSTNGSIYIDNEAGGMQSSLAFLDAGATKWQLGKQVDNSFFMWDNVNSKDFLRVSTAGDLFLEPVSGIVSIGSASPTSRLLVSGNMEIDGAGNGIQFPDGSVQTTAAAGGNIAGGQSVTVSVDPGNDTTQANAFFGLNSREAGGSTHQWRMYTATIGGGWGVIPNGFDVWEYDGKGCTPGGICNSRFGIDPSASGITAPPVRIDGSGNVGIGTANPDRPLSILGTGGNDELISLKDTSGNTKWHLNMLGTGLNFAETGVTDGRLYLQPGGNVGIGTTNPNKLLNVYSSGSQVPLIEAESDMTGQYTVAGLVLRNDEVLDPQTEWWVFAEKDAAGAATGPSSFRIRKRNDSQTQAFDAVVIDGNTNNILLENGYNPTGQTPGNVGIQTTSPTSPLTVNGNVEIDGTGNGIKFPDGKVQTTACTPGRASAIYTVTLATLQGLQPSCEGDAGAGFVSGFCISACNGYCQAASTYNPGVLNYTGGTAVNSDGGGNFQCLCIP